MARRTVLSGIVVLWLLLGLSMWVMPPRTTDGLPPTVTIPLAE